MKDIRYGYSVIDESDIEFITNVGNDPINPGIMAMEGIDTQKITLPSQDLYRMKVLILGQGISNVMTYAGIGSGIIEVGPGVPSTLPPTPSAEIPGWIKNNAEWWSSGQIDDNSFVQGIQWLIENDIMRIPETQQGTGSGSNEIPSWIKTNAEWWSQGLISDNDFVQGIQWLIENDIMRIA